MAKVYINGVEFQTIRSDKTEQMVRQATGCKGVTLNQCYRKPSATKQAIYDEWHKWASDTACVDWFGVCGHNCDTFSLSAIYFDIGTDEILGAFHITKGNNRLYLYK